PAKHSWTDVQRLTTNPGPDASVVLATAPDGTVWTAWQAWIDGQADILLAPVQDARSPVHVSNTPANEWSPALAVDRTGRLHVAFDSYAQGHYDVVLRSGATLGALGPPVVVAGSPEFQAR